MNKSTWWIAGLAGVATIAVASCSDDKTEPNPTTGSTDAGVDTGSLDAGAPSDGSAPSDAGTHDADGADARAEAGPSDPFLAKVGGNLARPGGMNAKTQLSGAVAMVLPAAAGSDIPTFVKGLVDQVNKGQATTVPFPVTNAFNQALRAVPGLTTSVAAKWLDPMTGSAAGPRVGSNADYLAYFGDGWNAVSGDPPQWRGSGELGWLWMNNEYVSGKRPFIGAPPGGNYPIGQALILATFLKGSGALTNDLFAPWTQPDVDKYIVGSKRQLGGTWVRVRRDASGVWGIDTSAANVRYDATSDTLFKVTGQPVSAETTDDGTALPAGVVPGTLANCSGGVTPWGTVLSGEENAQSAYGDLEACWDASNALVPGKGCDGATVAFPTSPSSSSELGAHSVASQRHKLDSYGYVTEFDVGQPPGEYEGKTSAGVGHKKLGALGRARWENATFAVDADWKLANGKPVVLYATDDRVSGRIYKWVSDQPYTTGMTKAQARALLDSGSIYAAHFAGVDNTSGYKLKATGAPPTEAARGTGQWIRLSVSNTTDDAPNSVALGGAKKVGAALLESGYNKLAAFPTDADVRRALFTASNKIGIVELNRPEDIEWNPKAPGGKPQLFVAFTKNTARTALDANLVLTNVPGDAGSPPPARTDKVGAIFAMEEANTADPSASTTFTFFQVWSGAEGTGLYDAANPDNILIDKQGGVWFGTDGNYSVNKTADAFYFLDLDPAHKAGAAPTFGKAFRIAAMPSDAENTGPALSSDMKTLFFSVQHPGEDIDSTWPF